MRAWAEQPAAVTARAGALVPVMARVVARTVETADTVTLRLALRDEPASRPRAGQFAMVGAPGAGEAPLSLSGLPAPGSGEVLHTVRDVGGVTAAVAGARPGDLLTWRGPYGVGWRAEDVLGAGDLDLVVVAGGIGLAPLRPVLQAAAGRAAGGRRVLLYGARTPAEVLYPADLEAWGLAGLQVEVTVDAAGSGWTGHVGLVTALLSRGVVRPRRTLALVCGPEVMMRLVAARLTDLGVPAEQVRVSLERSMDCGVGLCGHCQLREVLVCVDGPVLPWERVAGLLAVREL